MQPEEERGDDAEVAAAAAQRPEEIGVLRLAGGDEAAVGQHHVGLEQVVDGQAELAGEVAEPAAEGDAADAGGGDDAAGGGQPEGVGGVVQIAQRARRPRRGRCGLPGRRGRRSSGERSMTSPSSQVPRPGPLWPPPRMATRRPLLAGEVDRGDDVGDVGALGDEGRVLVDHRVVDRAGLVVAGVAGLDEMCRAWRRPVPGRLFRRGCGAISTVVVAMMCLLASSLRTRDSSLGASGAGPRMRPALRVAHPPRLRISGTKGRVGISVILTVPAGPTQSRPRLSACVAASRRLATPSLLRMCATWDCTVRGPRKSASAISLSVCRCASKRRTSTSRCVRPAG